MTKTLPTIERVREVLSYDPDTGVFIWRMDRGRTARAGHKAGWVNQDGYIRIETLGAAMMAHRLAWFVTYGMWPKEELDHINCNRADNRLVNLREATRAENTRNARTPVRNTSGFKGVSFHKRMGKWQAQIQNGKVIFLGYYDSPEEAHQAYVMAASRFHGDFARAS